MIKGEHILNAIVLIVIVSIMCHVATGENTEPVVADSTINTTGANSFNISYDLNEVHNVYTIDNCCGEYLVKATNGYRDNKFKFLKMNKEGVLWHGQCNEGDTDVWLEPYENRADIYNIVIQYNLECTEDDTSRIHNINKYKIKEYIKPKEVIKYNFPKFPDFEWGFVLVIGVFIIILFYGVYKGLKYIIKQGDDEESDDNSDEEYDND